jgi:hypothetical protein
MYHANLVIKELEEFSNEEFLNEFVRKKILPNIVG